MKLKHKTIVVDSPKPYTVDTTIIGKSSFFDPDKDTELKNLLKAIYEAGAIGSHRSLSDDVAAVRRLV